MKILHNIILLSLINSSINTSGQEWAPVGAKWYYTPPISGNCVYIECVKDTVVNDQQSKLLEVRYCIDDQMIAREIIYQNGDSILNLHDSSFVLLYDLAAEIGDTIKVFSNEFVPSPGFLHQGYPETIGSFAYKIFSYDSINISGEWRKRQRISIGYVTEWRISIGNYPYIIDGIGSMCYFFGRYSGMIPEESMGQLRCYSDNSIEWHNPQWLENCDYLFTEVFDPSSGKEPLIYPNPFHDKIRIELLSPYAYEATIFDISGKTILRTRINSSAFIGENLPIGFYILKLRSEKQQITYKLCKIN